MRVEKISVMKCIFVNRPIKYACDSVLRLKSNGLFLILKRRATHEIDHTT